MSFAIQNVRCADKALVDLFIENGKIKEIGPGGSLCAGTEPTVDAAGYILLAPLNDCHAHLDKTTMGLDWIENHVESDLMKIIDNERKNRLALGLDPYRQKAGRAAAADAPVFHHLFPHLYPEGAGGCHAAAGNSGGGKCHGGCLCQKKTADPVWPG